MKRGDIVTIALPGDYGKPRPALVIQSDLFNDSHGSVTVLPVTSTILPTPIFRITVEPSASNGLRLVSQIMVDKAMTLPREKIGQPIGMLEPEIVQRVERALAVWIGLA